MKKALCLSVILSMVMVSLVACPTWNVQATPKNVLYAINQNWQTIQNTVARQYVAGQVTVQQWASFQDADFTFSMFYNTANNMRKAGKATGPDWDATIIQLNKMLLAANEKYNTKK